MSKVVSPKIPARHLRISADGILSGYLILWGATDIKDYYGTWFDKSRPPDLGLENLNKLRIMYEHSMDAEIDNAEIGFIESFAENVVLNKLGVKFTGQLYKSDHEKGVHFLRVVDEIQREKLATSTGSDHTARFREDMSFDYWPLTEVSLTSAPAETRMPKVTVRNGQHPVLQRMAQRIMNKRYAKSVLANLEDSIHDQTHVYAQHRKKAQSHNK